ncbi:2-C-methyl-D-erythritol 4-phosphate cytidylyltransferase [Paenibacillus sp. CAA11]|uniref:2-C-methyl-D-erythritol 4-phosphate cytidylyltransferase n=1 Tax=Paenibacillus sp. CAA11 TaxID=1532905 RepID=UPI000D3AEA8F|nr:2-C-methyl-D-erythritol 4-phosphate cytidylyltransferase [Paenibacillus sp. CAA11]AWB46160.1 2-C-methyl-D-erythritol 4-phosphate cytidylyltransferase [Paenibacillus sp. CAA11]
MAEANQQVGAIVVAAGRGTRMGSKESKQYLLLEGKPILIHTLETFQRQPLISNIVIVTGQPDVERCREWVRSYGLDKVTEVIAGGSERQESVYLGLQAIQTPWVLVHDGVRPFVTGKHIADCCEAAWADGASVLAVPVKDTVKVVDAHAFVESTPDRRSLWAIQTPQAFRRSELLEAHEKARREGFLGTDDSVLVERIGRRVKVVEGDYSNIKITTPEDLDYAEFVRTRARSRGED